MIDKAKHVWYLYLLGESYRQPMIDWAVECIEEGLDGKYLFLLAGAVFEDDLEVRELFQFAVQEIGLADLPLLSEALDEAEL